MGDVVSDGESLTCPFCTNKVKVGVSSSSAQGDSKNLATTSNHSLSAPGAQCIVVPSAPAPCQPSAQVVDPGQSPLSIDGNTALGASCKLMCCKGGLLTVSSSAQSSAIHNGAANADTFTPPEIPPIGPREAANDDIGPHEGANDNKYKQKKDKPKKIRDERGKLLDSERSKPVTLPSAKKVKLDMPHITSGHQQGGARAAQSKIKTTFPAYKKEKQIKRSVLQAYKRCKPIERQGDSVLVRGVSDDGQKIEMWVNTKTKTIKTAYPVK